MVEIACKDIVFHFNKKHLEDNTIPMWVVKTKGKTFYVNHVEADIPWTTKETPDNESTKGSIKFKSCKLTITDDNTAQISKLSMIDKMRLKEPEEPKSRIIFTNKNPILWLLQHNEIEHSPCYIHHGSCGSVFYVLELKTADLTMLSLTYTKNFRILEQNEWYYKRIITKEIATLDPDYVGKIEKSTELDQIDEVEDFETGY